MTHPQFLVWTNVSKQTNHCGIQINNYNCNKPIMSKQTLVDILFDRGIQPNSAKKLLPPQRQQNKISWKKQSHQNQKHGISSNNKVIKITQFNSSIVISDDRLLQKECRTSYSISPQKPFSVKKMSDFKNKMLQHAQKYVEIELKKKDKQRTCLLKQANLKFGQIDPQQEQKLMISSNWTFKVEVPKIDMMIPGLNTSHQSFNALQSINESSKAMNPLELCEKIIETASKQIFDKKKHKTGSPPDINNRTANNQWASTSKNSQKEVRKLSTSPRKQYVKQLHEQKRYQESIENEKKELLEIKKQLNRNYAKPFNPPENVTAFSYIIYEANYKKNDKLKKFSSAKRQEEAADVAELRKLFLHSHQVVVSLNSRTQVQIASLTKIMTCILALDLGQRFFLKLNEEFVTIGLFEQNIGGTSANIKKGQIYSIEQLLYGLMLPSGNDASLAIAVWAGRLLLQQQRLKKQKQSSPRSFPANYAGNQFRPKKRQSYERFVVQMNNKANDLNMEKTKYCNSHGLANPQNKSCAYDLCILCEYAMNNKQFKEIVGSKFYESQIQIQIDQNNNLRSTKSSHRDSKKTLKNKNSLNTNREGDLERQEMKDLGLTNQIFAEQQEENNNCNQKDTLSKTIRWQNTHQLLQEKPELYVGVKTGITDTAGPCLSSCIEIHNRRFILIVLNCKSMKYRTKDTEVLRKWLFHKQSIKYVEKADKIEKSEKDERQHVDAKQK